MPRGHSGLVVSNFAPHLWGCGLIPSSAKLACSHTSGFPPGSLVSTPVKPPYKYFAFLYFIVPVRKKQTSNILTYKIQSLILLTEKKVL